MSPDVWFLLVLAIKMAVAAAFVVTAGDEQTFPGWPPVALQRPAVTALAVPRMALLIGLDPFRIDNLWQRMMRGYFYPAGREKTHSLGALDMALWDLKAKGLGVPIWQLLGGKSRDYVELYATAYPRPQPGATIADTAQQPTAASAG